MPGCKKARSRRSSWAGRGVITTEAGAEGINLQFCSLVINYDLPWNPQRIEQRIGRCHRYGQKFDVVVVNFIDRSNEADRRVYELLAQKFQLFEGIFGASDEVLGAIGSGVDFERRIAAIYQNCRTSSEIQASFEQLQLDLSGEIGETLVKTRQLLPENFDEQVQEKLCVRATDSRSARSRFERMLMDLTRSELDDCARFDNDGFDLQRIPDGIAASDRTGIALGRYEWLRRSGDARLYRIQHPLAQWIARRVKARTLDAARLVFDYTAHGTRISTLEPYRGKTGWLTLQLIEVEALGHREQHLLAAAVTHDGTTLAEDDPGKLLCLPAISRPAGRPDDAGNAALAASVETRRAALLHQIDRRNLGYFEQEVHKLDTWADDLKLGLEQEIKAIHCQIKEVRHTAAMAPTLQEKLSWQQQRELEGRRSKLRRELFARQDEIEAQRDALIGQLADQIKQRIQARLLFTVAWELR